MAGVEWFEENAGVYDAWFDKHHAVYQSELNAIRKLVGDGINGLEIGVGTGRFAVPLGIRTGLDAAAAMVTIAQTKGLNAVQGKAEALPYTDRRFEFVLMVNTVCYIDDIHRAIKESYRVIREGGYIVIAFFEKNGPVAKAYQKDKDNHPAYKFARFWSEKEIRQEIIKAGFKDLEYRQTLFDLDENRFHEVQEGSDKGGFVVIRGHKPE